MSTTVFDFLRWPRPPVEGEAARPKTRRRLWAVLGLGAFGGVAAFAFVSREPELPAGVAGTIVFVSDRSGVDSLYVRHVPDGRDTRLVALDEPVEEPALSPDGQEVAFSVGGRIGLVGVAGGPVRLLTQGSEWKDAEPVWRPDGRALFVAARKSDQPNRDIHELALVEGSVTRRPLVATAFLDESQPAIAPDGRHLVFLRDESLFRADTRDGRVKRLTGGFRKARAPRFLPDGRIAFLWSEGKEFGIDAIDVEGKSRETLNQGTACYRSIAPSPDGRYLIATFTYDLSFHFWQGLSSSHREELRLFDLRSQAASPLAKSWRYANHSADWGR